MTTQSLSRGIAAPALPRPGARLRHRLAPAIPVQRDEVRATEPNGTGPLFAPSARGALWDAFEEAILALDDARAETP